MQYDKIPQEVRDAVTDIVFQPAFGDEDPSKKIDQVIPLSTTDQYLIKKQIRQQFNIALGCNIDDMSTEELCAKVYHKLVKESKLQPFLRLHRSKSNSESIEQPFWTNREVFSYILARFGEVIGRRVRADERIGRLRNELKTKGKEEFDRKSCELSKFSGTPIDAIKNPSLAIYSIANQATHNLVLQGKAIDPKEEYKNIELTFVPIWVVTSFGCLTAILKTTFDILAPTKMSTKKMTLRLLGCKSFQETEDTVTQMIIDTKVYKIALRYDEVPLFFDDFQEASLGVISKDNAEYIKTDVQQDFGITVDYDISGTSVNRLCSYVNNKVSNNLRNKLIGKKEIPKQAIEKEPERTEKHDESNQLTRDEIFSDIISAFCGTLGRGSIKAEEKIRDLFLEMRRVNRDPDKLKATIKQLAERYDIIINVRNPELQVYNICDAAHRSFVNQGKSEFLHVPIDEMDALWGAYNKAISAFVYLKSVLINEADAKISVYALSNCRTYDEYKQLVISKNKYGPEVSEYIALTNPTYEEYHKFIEMFQEKVNKQLGHQL